ncbi:Arginine exporter protein ArgO OS=Streptomyces griseomycini OX=66895 GN=FHS37_005510 PE=3 SV=1 [Streptomyces griseomycini]
MTAALVAGLLAGYGIAVPVGAVGTYLVSLTARTSLRTGVCAALGVATADGLYALAAVAGGSALASALRPALGPLRWVCVLVLLALAAWGAADAVRRYRGGRLATRSGPAPRAPRGRTWRCSGSPCSTPPP